MANVFWGVAFWARLIIPFPIIIISPKTFLDVPGRVFLFYIPLLNFMAAHPGEEYSN